MKKNYSTPTSNFIALDYNENIAASGESTNVNWDIHHGDDVVATGSSFDELIDSFRDSFGDLFEEWFENFFGDNGNP